MKRILSLLLVVILCGLLMIPVIAAPEGPVIIMQPQSPSYPEYSVAIYTVKAEGTNLTATWYIEYEGKTYNASQIGGAMQPWEGYAGESYGAKKLDDNTFCFIFEGIEAELNGAEIWCEIEDGHYDVVSQVAYISVGDFAAPPEILEMPTSITVAQEETAEIRCVAKSTDESQLIFLWYETDSGLLPDIRAIDRGAETADYMLCNTEQPGTYYYVCGVTTSAGGTAYSSAVEVNVVEKTTTPVEPTTQTDVPPQTTAETEQTQPEGTTATTAPTEAPTKDIQDPAPQGDGLSWWVLVLIGVAAAGAGVGVAILLVKRKS